MKKGFAITGLVFVFVALIFGAANHIYFANHAKQNAIDFAFMTDGVNSIANDFPRFIADSEGKSLSHNILMRAGCKVPDAASFQRQIRTGIDNLNLYLHGTGIKIEIISDEYNIFPQPCPKNDPIYCGSVATVSMQYKIKTPYFERTASFNNQRAEVCTFIPRN